MSILDFFRERLGSNYPVDPFWDDVLSEALDRHMPVMMSDLYAMVGGHVVWVGNYPYAYGNKYNTDALPRMATRRRLHQMLLSQPEYQF